MYIYIYYIYVYKSEASVLYLVDLVEDDTSGVPTFSWRQGVGRARGRRVVAPSSSTPEEDAAMGVLGFGPWGALADQKCDQRGVTKNACSL